MFQYCLRAEMDGMTGAEPTSLLYSFLPVQGIWESNYKNHSLICNKANLFSEAENHETVPSYPNTVQHHQKGKVAIHTKYNSKAVGTTDIWDECLFTFHN
ncbi:UNVERIFIED_CONTAM: hypothetical protein K2H54_050878 [Gekko kuhli]